MEFLYEFCPMYKLCPVYLVVLVRCKILNSRVVSWMPKCGNLVVVIMHIHDDTYKPVLLMRDAD